MFDRLIESLGTVSTKDDAIQMCRAEMQLATAILLFAVIPADMMHAPEESVALQDGLIHIFNISEERCQKLIARAAAQFDREPGLLAPATLLKHRMSLPFRRLILATAGRIAKADGAIHEFEIDVLARIESLLGLRDGDAAMAG